MKLDLVGPALSHERRKTKSFYGQIFGVLEAENCGDAEFLFEPRNIFDPWVFADKKNREDLTDLRSSRAVIVRVMGRKGVVETSHVGKVEKVREHVKVQPFDWVLRDG